MLVRFFGPPHEIAQCLVDGDLEGEQPLCCPVGSIRTYGAWMSSNGQIEAGPLDGKIRRSHGFE